MSYFATENILAKTHLLSTIKMHILCKKNLDHTTYCFF